MRFLYVATFASLLTVGSIVQAHAAFTTIDISSAINSNVSSNPASFPVGTTTGNEGTGIPFDIATYGSHSYAGVWLAKGQSSSGTSSVFDFSLTALNISGELSFYALLNNYYGTLNSNEYNVTITATDGDKVTYSSIGGFNTRDYNQNPNTSNTVSATTTYWFNNGLGQRLDVREFTLPTSFATETLASFEIDQLNSNDPAVLSGLTFSTDPATFAVPEPSSIAMYGAAIIGLFSFLLGRGPRKTLRLPV